MAQFRWIIMSSFLMLLFQFTAASWQPSFSTVRAGDEVTLSCGNVIDDRDTCDSTTWTFSGSGNTVTLFEHGRIHKEVKVKSDRLSVTEKCFLVIKKVTEEDAGQYTCTQLRSKQELSHYQYSGVDLSVVTMTEQKDTDRVIFFCSVSPRHACVHTVKWLYESDKNDVETRQLPCSATVTVTTSHLNQTSKYSKFLKCEVTHEYSREVQLFPFIPPQSSGEKPGLWRIIVSLGFATLIIIVVAINIWTRAKENKTQTEENIEHNDEGEDTVNYENDAEASSSV